MLENTLHELADLLVARDWQLATAESCTGGGIAQVLTQISGASAWFSYSVVSYSNEAKIKILSVSPDSIEQFGAVSLDVAEQMVTGVANLVDADVSVSVTGVAGPSGGSPEKPVGTVCIAWYVAGHTFSERFQFEGDRESVRSQSIQAALEGLLVRIR